MFLDYKLHLSIASVIVVILREPNISEVVHGV